MSNAALLERQVAIRLDGDHCWTIVGESEARAIAPEVVAPASPEERLARLKAKARRRAATRPEYQDSAESTAELHESVIGAMPLQLRVVADLED